MTYRLMVVGSIDWEEEAIIHTELSKAHDLVNGMPITLVTVGLGGHGKGAEAIAVGIADDLGWEVEIHPRDFSQFRTSPYLSAVAEIVDTKPDICLAFISKTNDISDMGAGMAETLDIQTFRHHETNWD